MEQVSRFLCTLLSDHNVWSRILRETCIKEGLFQPSYPVDDMTLQEIQQASLSPSRWRNRICSNIIGNDLNAFCKSIKPFHDCLEHPIAPAKLHRNAFLIPGGRYLVSVPKGHDIEIYDLGVSGRPISKQRSPIARIEGEAGALGSSFIVTPLNDAEVRVVLPVHDQIHQHRLR